jgi:hypothetical protein
VSNFQQPGIANPEDKIVWAENLGALLLFFPTRLDTKIPTQHGETDAVAAKVVRLEDGRVWENGMVFPTALVTQLKSAIPDGMVLGRLGQGENKKGNAPWLLQAHTAEDVAKAEAWLAANPRISQPVAPSGPPTPPAWGAPATQAAPQWGGQAPASPPAQGGWAAPAAPAPAPGGWGQQAPAPTPQAGGWGAPAPAAPSAPQPGQGQFAGQWDTAAPAAPPVSDVHPGLAAAIQAAGYPVPADQATALQMAAALGLQPPQ